MESIPDDLSNEVDYDISRKKFKIYTVPGVDEAIYSKEHIKKAFLIRPTKHKCPKCSSILYNVQLDGVHFYCPVCEVHHEI